MPKEQVLTPPQRKDEHKSGNGSLRKPPKVVGDEQAEAFNRVVEDRTKVVSSDKNPVTGSRVGVFTHRFPDPDAIGSMMGIGWLLKKVYGINVDLFYYGEVAHPQNKMMCGSLDPQMLRVEEQPKDFLDQYILKILVDTIPSNAGTAGHPVQFDIVIDHHKDLPGCEFRGETLHRKTGSAAAIVYDLIKHLVKPEQHGWFDSDVDLDIRVATAMIVGVVTDTEFLMSDDTTELEFQCYRDLFPFRNSVALKQIVFFKRPQFWVQSKAKGCVEADVEEEFAVVGLGLIPDKDRDLIADMAEEMVSWTGVDTAIAFGVVGGNRIEGSVRSLTPSFSVPEFCKKLAAKHKDGEGGGKQQKGAYRIPLGGASIDPGEDEADVQEAWNSIRTREIKRIKKLISK